MGENPPEIEESQVASERDDHSLDQEVSEFREFIDKIMPFLARFKNTPLVYPLYYFYFAFGIIFLIALALFDQFGEIELQFYISETAENVVFPLPVGELISVILLGGIFPLFALRAFELLRSQVSPDRKSYGTRLFVIILYVSFMILLIIGTVVHMVGNQLHAYIYEIEETMVIDPHTPLGNLKAGIYLWDEIIGHILIAVGYFGMMYINVFFALIDEDNLRARNDEMVFITLGGFLLGAGIAFGFIEGQAGYTFLYLAILLVVLIPIIMHKNKFHYHQKPFVYCALVLNIAYIVVIILFIVLFGVKPYYPYLYQPSELEIF